MNLWQNTGATVIAILQNDELIISPGPYATLNQYDTLYFVGGADSFTNYSKFLFYKKLVLTLKISFYRDIQ